MMRKLLPPLAMQIDPFWLRPDNHVVPIEERRESGLALAWRGNIQKPRRPTRSIKAPHRLSVPQEFPWFDTLPRITPAKKQVGRCTLVFLVRTEVGTMTKAALEGSAPPES